MRQDCMFHCLNCRNLERIYYHIQVKILINNILKGNLDQGCMNYYLLKESLQGKMCMCMHQYITSMEISNLHRFLQENIFWMDKYPSINHYIEIYYFCKGYKLNHQHKFGIRICIKCMNYLINNNQQDILIYIIQQNQQNYRKKYNQIYIKCS